MSEILRTTLATSQPLTLTRGFPFFHPGTFGSPQEPVIIGIGAVPTLNLSFWEVDLPLALYRVRCNISATLVAGAFFGYNLQYDIVGGTNSDGTATVILSNDSAQGGLGIGLGFTLSFAFNIQRNRITFTWRSGFRQSWERWFNFTTSATIDLIAITLKILEASGVRVPMSRINQLADVVRNGPVWGLIDSARNQFSSRGELTFNPRLSVSGNLLKLVPGLAELVTAMGKAGMKLTFGPVVNFIFPVTIRVVGIITDDGLYPNVTRRRNGLIDLSGGPVIPIGQPPTQKVEAIHSHEIGVNLTLDVKLTFAMWGIFSLGGTFPINLGAAMPIQVGTRRGLGPYFNKLSNVANSVSQVGLPEVVWG